MPNLICSQCTSITEIKSNNWKLYSGHDFDNVCSIDCFLNWITSYEKPVPTYTICADGLMLSGDVWSEKAQSFFRSEFEKDTAEFFLRNNTTYFYEAIQFRVGKSIYIPDFYLPHWNKFVEVKGIWNSSAKTKYRNFNKLYPSVRILLLDWRHHNTIKER